MNKEQRQKKLTKLSAALYCLSLKSMGDLNKHVQDQIDLENYEYYYLIRDNFVSDDQQVELVQARAREVICALFEELM